MDGSEFFNKLHSFFTGSPDEFEDVFGEREGTHLAKKWIACGFDLVVFIGTLDIQSRDKLYKFLTKGE
jgi:hypothetical protein